MNITTVRGMVGLWLTAGAIGGFLLLSGCEGNVGPWSPAMTVNKQEAGVESEPHDGGQPSGTVEQTSSVAVDAGVSSAPRPDRCGNGTVEDDEECDDANDASSDGCFHCRMLGVCGNGIKEDEEECDSDAENCVDCKLTSQPECGNNNVEGAEECDDGNEEATDGCAACQIAWCGDGVVNAGEACDDGNNVEVDGCNSDCEVVTCGDGQLQQDEECDPPGETCSLSCKIVPSSCGNGEVEQARGEQCEDGNEDTGDGCHQCRLECGDGKVDRSIGETCEPGTAYLTCQSSNKAFCLSCSDGLACDQRDACNPETCTHAPACGDGIVQPEYGEACDPPGSRTCDRSCKLVPARCGNEQVEGAEQCDPPDGKYCGDQCQHLGCGNGMVEGQEECEPPNTDGCDDECRVIAACEATDPPVGDGGQVVVTNLFPGGGTFDDSIDGWIAQSAVSASHVTDIGNVGLGALRVEVAGAVASTSSLDIRGVARCLSLKPNTAYTFSGSYRFGDETPAAAGATVSLHLYPSANCSGTVTPNRGAKIAPIGAWSRYTQAVDTSVLGAVSDVSVYVRLDVWRPTTVASVETFWDDLDLRAAGEIEPDPEPQGGYCGDCLVQSAEACDDGNREGGDGCSDSCRLEECGNGAIDVGEQCDDANQAYNDGCDGDCRVSDECRECVYDNSNILGDGDCSQLALNEGRGCFDLEGVAESGRAAGVSRASLCSELFECVRQTGCFGSTASSQNALPGAVQGMENCYCGNTGDRCLNQGEANGSCREEVERALESQDPTEIIWRMSGSNTMYPVFAAAQALLKCAAASCAESCVEPVQCGNGVKEDRPLSFLSEYSPGTFKGTDASDLTCDDLTAGVVCYPEETCGCFFEECDDGNALDGDGCDSSCFIESCGNGVLQTGEGCDDGNRADGDGCSGECQGEWECGDGLVEGEEACDDGNLANLDGCDSGCKEEVCGNGVVQAQLGEQCDPDVSGVCENCKFVQQDACTECVLEIDIWKTLSDPSRYVSSECVGIGVLDQSTYQDEVGASVPPGLPNGIRCLGNPDCLAAWQCFADSRCLLNARNHECYCGQGTDVIECNGKPPSWASGVCKDAMIGAFTAQFNRPPVTNDEMLTLWQDWSGDGEGYPLAAASSLALQCLADPYSLDLGLCDSGVSHERRVECQNHCFGEQGLSDGDVTANQCL